jgi:hypothetical protein
MFIFLEDKANSDEQGRISVVVPAIMETMMG